MWPPSSKPIACFVLEAWPGSPESAALLRCWILSPADSSTGTEFAPILDRDLAEGQHRNPTSKLLYFTDAFFHRPDELAAELYEAGFELVELVPVEGPGWLARDFDRLWNDPQQRERLLALLRKVEHEPALIGASSHILAIGRKR